MKKVSIGNRLVGPGEPCFIIAEAGSNHDRNLGQARKLIEVAAEAGADAVKFQAFRAETLLARESPRVGHIDKGNKNGKSTFEIIKGMELPGDWLKDLAEHAGRQGLAFLVTPFDLDAVEELAALGVPAMKIGSGDITYVQLIKKAASTGKPVILSTGASSMDEVRTALGWIREEGNEDVVLLQCQTSYPAPPEQANLTVMDTMRKEFGVPAGCSDHTLGIEVPIAAATLGACVIEKHFTLSRNMAGPDHLFALEPRELADMVAGIRKVESALGTPAKEVTASEKANLALVRRSLHARRDIPAGTQVTDDDIAIVRPADGVAPVELPNVVGRKAAADIAEGRAITTDMVC